MSHGAIFTGASVLLALVLTITLVNEPSSDEMITPIAPEPKLRNMTIGVIPGMSSSLPYYTFLTNLAEDDINKYCVDKGLEYRFRFNISKPVEQSPQALKYTKDFLSSGVKVILGFEWSSHFCSGARVFGYNKTMVLMSPSAGFFGYSIANDTLYRLCTTDFTPLNMTLRAMSDRGIKAVVAFSVYDENEYNFNSLIKQQLTPLGIEHYASVASPSITDDYPILDTEKLLDRADSAVAEAIQKYGANATAILFLPGSPAPEMPWSTDDPDKFGPSILDVVEAAANRPYMSSVTWFGLEASANKLAYEAMPDGAAARLKIISSVETFTQTPSFDRVNALWLASKEANPNNVSLNTYTANIYDGLWVLSLSVIEANSTEPLQLMKIIPDIASRYVGATGRCTLNKTGDRLGANFDFYSYTMVNGGVKSIKLGSYTWEIDEFTWSDAKG